MIARILCVALLSGGCGMQANVFTQKEGLAGSDGGTTDAGRIVDPVDVGDSADAGRVAELVDGGDLIGVCNGGVRPASRASRYEPGTVRPSCTSVTHSPVVGIG